MKVYEHDRCRLMVGEALEALTLIEPGSVNAVITDPPYSSGGMFRADRSSRTTVEKYVQSGTIREHIEFDGDCRDQRGYGYWVALWLAKCREICAPESVALLFTDWRQLPMTTDAIQAAGWIYRGIFPWDKTACARPVQGRLANQCEYVVWGSNGSLPLDRDAETLHGFMSIPAPRERVHMTQKPLELMRYLVRTCRRGGTILDPFCGSGTTGVAAQMEGYGFIGVESNEQIAELAWRRLNGLQAVVNSQTATLF